MNPVALNPYAMNVRPQVTSVPMINMRIPPQLTDTSPVHLKSALEQYQFFIEGGQIVPRQTSLIWSRGVLIFYVDRRATSVKLNNHLEQFSMSRLPVSIAGFERLNKREVVFEDKMKIGAGTSDDFELRSVVFSEVNVDDKGADTDYVIGSSTLIRYLGPFNKESKIYEGTPEFLCYDPYAPLGDQSSGSTVGRSPMRKVHGNNSSNGASNNFCELAKSKGTIFVYSSMAEDKVLDLAF
jgi:hypothetical protein